MKKAPSYFRKRIAVLEDLVEKTDQKLKIMDEDSEKAKKLIEEKRLLINGKVPDKYDEENLVESAQAVNADNKPLSFTEVTRYNNHFAMHPEKVAGKEVLTTSRSFPILVKGSKEDVLKTLKAKSLNGMEKETPAAHDEEVKFIQQYVALNDTTQKENDIIKFIQDLQGAIQEGIIGKDSPFAKEIEHIQGQLIKVYKAMNGSIRINIDKKMISKLQKRISDTGLGILPTMAAAAAGAVASKIVKGMFSGTMDSEELAGMQFETIGLTGKWKDLIGDPAKGAKVIIHGNPKGGKSTMCLMFAKYLAENHGETLYASIEEGFVATMTEKINRLKAAHPQLKISDTLPKDLSPYQFVFIDSATKKGLDHLDMERFNKKYPDSCFFYIIQETKDGKFRGSKEIEHEADTIIRVDSGHATSYGRFNQGGEMDIFPSNADNKEEIQAEKDLDVSENKAMLSGLKNENMKSKKKLKTEDDWTKHPELHEIERSHLIRVKRLYEEGNMKEAMRQAAFLDTFQREMIPPKIWVEMGGDLTPKGKERLMSSNFSSRPDDLNPNYIFSVTPTALLVEALKSGFDLKLLIRKELANRGQNDKGDWVGFDQAAKVHKLLK